MALFQEGRSCGTLLKVWFAIAGGASIALAAWLYFVWDGPEADEVFVDDWVEIGFVGFVLILAVAGVVLIGIGLVV